MQKFLRRKYCAYAALLVVAAVVLWFFIGCADVGNDGITLAVEQIVLCEGESRDVFPYVRFLPATTADKNITLTSNDGCVTVSDSTVTAVKAGLATVTVASSGGTAELSVSVVYRAPTSFSLSADENAVQTVEDGKSPKPVELNVTLGDLIDPELPVEWTVDGTAISDTGRSIVFTPTGYGEYEVQASVAGITESKLIRVYKNTEVVAWYSGQAEQIGTRTAVEFYLKESVDPDNPPSTVEWSVNGAPVCYSPFFRLEPSVAGEYAVSLKVNGVSVDVAGSDCVTVDISGQLAPVCSVEFDDMNGVFVVWEEDACAVSVTVITPAGKRYNIDRSDAQYAYLFGSGSFDATDYIDLFGQDAGEYKITVRTDDGASECSFTELPLIASEFVSSVPFMSNMFVSSADDGIALVEELYACGINDARCYIAADGAADAMVFYAGTVLGTELTVKSAGDNVFVLSFDEIVNAPEYYDDIPNVLRMYSEFPDIEYDAAKRRPSTYVFASERVRRTVTVSTSEQLFLAVTRGYRPLPEADSTAELIYGVAKNRLLNIIGAGYDEYRKVRAVYDWMQWVSVRGTPDKHSAANYLESFFGSGEIGIGDVRRASVSPLGAAKIFAFLCGLEGVECDIITDGYNYRNKVRIDGLYYNVDVLGGKAYSSELGIVRSAELNSRRALLISDDEASRIGLFDASSVLPAFDMSKSAYFNKIKTADAYFDMCITDCTDYDDIKAAVFYGFSRTTLGAVSVPALSGTETYMNSSLGAELYVYGTPSDKQISALIELLSRAVDEYRKTVLDGADVVSAVYRAGNNILLTVSVPQS